MSDDPIVISGAIRTPMGGMMGSLSAMTASELGALSIGQKIAAIAATEQQQRAHAMTRATKAR